MRNPLGLSPLEIASGYVLGEVEPQKLPPAAPHGDASRALEAAVLPALRRPPCVVTFSGGRDSSAVLAVAAHVARREGLPLPIPFTYRFPAASRSEESAWQERVVHHLRLDDWVRRSFDEELDCLGQLATAELIRHGLLWPPNIHFFVPALNAAGSGSLLTGHGGDEVLHPGRHAHVAAVLALRERPQLRDVGRLLLAAAPATLRERRRRRERASVASPWLRPAATEAVLAACAREAAREPVRRRAWVAWIWRLRSIQLTLRSMAALADHAGTAIHHPFLDPGFLSTYADRARARPSLTRTDAIRELFGDVLPGEVIGRGTKATFDGAFWGRRSREFALSLTAADVDSELVDGSRALAFWAADGTETAGPIPSATLLQALWLERNRASALDGVEERSACVLEQAPVARATEL